MLIAVAVANRHITGVAVVGVGLLLNLVGGGGERRDARARRAPWWRPAWSPRASRSSVEDPRHLETPDDPLPVLGDVLPVPLTNEVVSFGDLIVIVGAADAVRELSRRRARPRRQRRLSVRRARRSASVDQVWGTAPSGAPVSATQCSANPERSTPVTIDLTSAEPASSDRSWWRRARAGR